MSPRFRIKSIGSDGMQGNIRYWHLSPPKPHYTLEVAIGEARTKKFENFKVLVATPEALREMADPGQVIVRDRAVLVVTEYDFTVIEAHLNEIVESCNRPEWSDTVHQLRRYFDWEWDGYGGSQA
jgi:hypothetical protein